MGHNVWHCGRYIQLYRLPLFARFALKELNCFCKWISREPQRSRRRLNPVFLISGTFSAGKYFVFCFCCCCIFSIGPFHIYTCTLHIKVATSSWMFGFKSFLFILPTHTGTESNTTPKKLGYILDVLTTGLPVMTHFSF